MAHEGPGDDPGWGSLGRVLSGAFLPGRAVRRAAAEPNQLLALRTVFLAFALAQVAVGVVVLVLLGDADRSDASIGTGLTMTGVFAAGLALVVTSWTLQRELPCGEVEKLLGAFRTRFFLRVAMAEASTLLGFAGSFLARSPLPYLAGLAAAAIGFARLAPTTANLQREDDALMARGCPHSLSRALLETPAGPSSAG